MPDQDIDLAIEGIADGTPVEWDALERALTGDERNLLKHLRVLGGIADLHRSTDAADAAQEETISPPGATQAAGEQQYEMWGRYRLLEKVGEGGFGSVYRAWDPELEREVAIKILHARVANTRLKEGLLREGRALAKVRHPHVVSVLGIESRGDQVALCMEFVRGETLEQVLRTHGTLNAREASIVGEDVCRALAAVHLAGFVHRDVKARNVMREQAGRVVLMDFGAGREADQLKAAGEASIVGTPAYMAPEVLAGGPATACSDVYSTGVLLYHLVTSEYPVEGRTVEELRAAHMVGRRRLLSERRPELPLPFIQVVERALAPDPERRFSSVSALLEALGTIAGAERRTWTVVRSAAALLGAFLTIGLLGFLTTAAFNLTVGRSAPFDRESPTVWIVMGLRSLVTPTLYIMAMLLVVWAARFGLRVLSLSRRIDGVLRGCEAGFKRLTARLNLDDPVVFAQAVATFGVIALAAILWRFSDVLRAAVAFTISNASAETLRPLRLDLHRMGPSLYRAALDLLALALGAALVRISQLRTLHRPAGRGAMAPVAALLVLTVLLIEVPFRLLWRNEALRLDVAGERCYMLGESADEALIFCPDRNPPRNQVIKLNDPAVRRLGPVESIFTPPDYGSLTKGRK
jgi:hypothetical protein